MFIIVLIIIVLGYIILINSLINGFYKVPVFKPINSTIKQDFTVIIPFRNESKNILALAESLEQLNYSQNNYEIIFINDDSTDNSVSLLTEFIINNKHWKLIDNIRKSNSPKKDAIELAIKQSLFNWIITTDADCIVPENWLNIYNDYVYGNKGIVMIAAPVTYKINNSFLHKFQLMDFLSLIGTTIGSFGLKKAFMCNGANLCYNKQAFINVDGFVGNNTIASGDDVFILEKFKDRYPNQVTYLKSFDSLVYTFPEDNVKSLIKQRIRWASKTSKTKSVFGKLIGVIVFLMNLIIIWSIFYGLWTPKYSVFSITILLLKLVTDYILLEKTYTLVGEKMNL